MEYQHEQKEQWSLAPHQIAVLRDAVNSATATTTVEKNVLIFLKKLLNVEDICTIAVSITHVENGVAVVNEDTTLWVRRARKHHHEHE